MANFGRGSLRYSYSWTASKEHDNARITGFPDNYLLDRTEGYEVLPFINRYMTAKGWVNEATFQGIEHSIRVNLPGNVRGHRTIKDWLELNFRIN